MAFNTSLSGINAANADLNVTSNNIANVNTTGFKESRAEFADMFQSTSYGLSRNAVGSGVRVSNVAQQFSQGNIDPTGRSLDLAISGEGFFAVSSNGAKMYTRAGNFQTDANGYVINPQGARLQVFAPNPSGNGFDVGRLSDLQLLTTDSPPKSTSTVNLAFTLPAMPAHRRSPRSTRPMTRPTAIPPAASTSTIRWASATCRPPTSSRPPTRTSGRCTTTWMARLLARRPRCSSPTPAR